VPNQPAQTGPTTEQVRELYGPDGSGTVVTDLQRPGNTGGGAVPGGPPSSSPTPDSPQEPQGPPDPNLQRIEIIGRRPLRDVLGNQYELAAEGYVVVRGPDGALTRIEAQQAQAWGLSAELAAATARALPGASGSAAVGALITRGLAFVVTAAPWTVAIGGLLSGDTERPLIVKFGDDTQYVQQPGQTSGQLQTFDPQTGELIDQEVRHGYTDNMGRFMVLTDEQLRNLQQPTATPGAQLPPQPPTPLPIDRPDSSTPGLEAAPPAGPSVETYPAEQMRLDDLIIESRGLRTGTPEHKAAAWGLYNQRPNGDWSYDHWSAVYDVNQTRAIQAHAAADLYRDQVGWGEREVTVETAVDGVPSARRLDIADERGQRGIEYKTGYQSATADNLWELQRDAELVKRGWQIEWVFKDRASQPLLDALDRAGIKHKLQGP
jgi:hypothetical protein